MDMYFITRHLICGIIPETAFLILYFIFLYIFGKKQTVAHIAASFILCLYLIGVLTVTGICTKSSFSPVVVFVPFLDMIRGPVETILNIMLFIPMGFLLPILYNNYDSISKIAIIGFIISLSIEIVQLFGYGATDINDLITNTAGACLGFLLYKTIKKHIPESWIIRIRVDGLQCYYELPIFWIGSILIMLTIQLYIFHVFFPVIHASGEMQVWN